MEENWVGTLQGEGTRGIFRMSLFILSKSLYILGAIRFECQVNVVCFRCKFVNALYRKVIDK